MKKIMMTCCLVLTGLWAYAQVEIGDPGATLEQKVQQMQQRRLEERGGKLSINDLGPYGTALVKHVQREIEYAQREIKTLPYPGNPQQVGREAYLENLGNIIDYLIGILDEYNAVRERDSWAARVAGGYIAQAQFVTNDAKQFQVQPFLKEHEEDLLDAVLLEELVQELKQFSVHVQEDLRYLKQ